MNPKTLYTAIAAIILVGGLYFVNAALKDEKPPVTDQINTNAPVETEEEEGESFNKTGVEIMEICNASSICHQGAVTFEAGEVLSITADDGAELGVEFSACDLESCYVEDVYSREWDLVWLEPLVE